MKREEGSIPCANTILDRVAAHNSLKATMKVTLATSLQACSVVFLFYRVVGRVDIQQLYDLLEQLKGKQHRSLCGAQWRAN